MMYLTEKQDFIALARRIVAHPDRCDGARGVYDCDFCPIKDKCQHIQDTLGHDDPDLYFKAKAQAFSEWLVHITSFGQPELWEDL